MRPPTAVGRAQLHEARRQPLVVEQAGHRAARERILELVLGVAAAPQIFGELPPEVVPPREDGESRLIGGPGLPRHQPAAAGLSRR